jgi:intergrase/recombinase
MKSLTVLAKYLGYYDRWQQLRKRYDLKLSNSSDSLQAFQRFFNPDLTLDAMIDKVREMMAALPPDMAEVVRFATLTGLRPAESIESVRLIKSMENFHKLQYYDEEQQTLRHYLFPSVFLRQTKKAYISYLSRDHYQRVANLGPKTPSWNAIRLYLKHRDLNMEMKLCRRIFASWLSQSGGIQSEAIDFLQGRVSTSVFSRHYLTPSSDLRNKVLAAIEQQLANKLSV